MGYAAIPIHAAERNAAQGCGACLHTAIGPVCRGEFGQACGAPELSGPADELSRVLLALHMALAADGVDAGDLVRALRLADGEAELVLAIAPRCAGAALADTAFQALRRALPDTDIYVTHAA